MNTALVLFSLLLCVVCGQENPGFFLKVSKNVPRIGRRSGEYENNFIKQTKSVPRIGRRSNNDDMDISEKYYNFVQPFDSKFILDFLSDQIFSPTMSKNNLKFVSWNDFDKALESDTVLFEKLMSLARDKEIDDLKRLIYVTYSNKADPDSVENKMFQKFVPLEMDKFSNNDNSNDMYYYKSEGNIKKKSGKMNL